MPKLHSIEDAAKLLGGISPWTLRKHIPRGTVKVVRVGRRVLIADSEIERLVQEGLPSLAKAA